MTTDWQPAGPDLPGVRARLSDPLRALANAEIPAIVLRGAYSAEDCAGLLQRFQGWGLIRDPLNFNSADKRTRIDVGTSLGNRGQDQDAFLAHAVHTHDLFPKLFAGFHDPVKTMYDALAALSNNKEVTTAIRQMGLNLRRPQAAMDDCLGVAFALFGILQTENPGKLMFKAIDRVVGALFTQAHAVDVWNVAVRFVVDAENGRSIAAARRRHHQVADRDILNRRANPNRIVGIAGIGTHSRPINDSNGT